MKRNLVALITGLGVSAFLVSITGFLVMKFKIYPFYDFYSSVVNKNSEKFFNLAEKISYLIAFIVFPIIAFITSSIVSLISLNKKTRISILSIVPLMVIFYFIFTKIFLYALGIIIVATVAGVKLTEFLSKRQNNGRRE